MALNKVIIMGRLTADPVLRYTKAGKQVASFSIAVERDYADQDGNRGADFLNVVAWNQAGEFTSKYFKKGSMAIIEGRLESRSWQDKNGNKRVSIEIIAERVRFGERKKDNERHDSPQNEEPPYTAPTQNNYAQN